MSTHLKNPPRLERRKTESSLEASTATVKTIKKWWPSSWPLWTVKETPEDNAAVLQVEPSAVLADVQEVPVFESAPQATTIARPEDRHELKDVHEELKREDENLQPAREAGNQDKIITSAESAPDTKLGRTPSGLSILFNSSITTVRSYSLCYSSPA